ncbi:hypothetical protein AB0F49_25055 [Micromonospora ureilytica]|uniref:hypothetical protein n=1 Tax=Micromonospora ureilytica TaxID=709868 RepID=UPI0033C169E2
MTAPNRAAPAIPDDDPTRKLTVANPDDPATTYISLAGDSYAMLITGKQTLWASGSQARSLVDDPSVAVELQGAHGQADLVLTAAVSLRVPVPPVG